MILSKRLTAVTELLPSGQVVADVGCDHGYISIHLIQIGKFDRALAMDIRKGPLSIAKDNINKAGLNDKIITRLSDGLQELNDREADSAVIAGMGGLLVIKILENSLDKIRNMNYIVLQPQSDIDLVRKYIRDSGLVIVKENMVKDEGKYYPMFLVTTVQKYKEKKPDAGVMESGFDSSTNNFENPDSESSFNDMQEIYDLYGRILIESKNEVLLEFLRHECQVLNDVLGKLPIDNISRCNEIKHKIDLNLKCQEMVN